MTKSLYVTLTGFKGDGNAFKDKLDELQLMPIFGNLYAIYQPREAQKAVLYILHVYSIDSPYLMQGEPLAYCKQRAAEKVGFPTDSEMYRELVNFEYTYTTKATKRKLKGRDEVDEIEPDDACEELEAQEYQVEKIITAVKAYLQYQDEPLYTHLLLLKDMYDQASTAMYRMIKKANNEVDFKQKMQYKEYAEQLMIDIKKCEKEIAEKNVVQKAQRDEVKELERKVFTSLRPETVL